MDNVLNSFYLAFVKHKLNIQLYSYLFMTQNEKNYIGLLKTFNVVIHHVVENTIWKMHFVSHWGSEDEKAISVYTFPVYWIQPNTKHAKKLGFYKTHSVCKCIGVCFFIFLSWILHEHPVVMLFTLL